MQKKTLLTAAISLAATQTAVYSTTANAESLSDLADKAKPIVNLNLRYETNDTDDATDKDSASAFTLRSRLGVQFGSYKGFTGLYEVEDVQAFVSEYAPEDATYDVVADPENTEVNRAQIQYSADGFTAIVGRQRIILDNARFVGNVGWRQNEQTFDAARLTYKTDDLTLQYAYIDQVNGILRRFDADVTDHLINVAYSGLPVGTITAFGYLLEDDDTEKTDDTIGFSLKGKQDMFLYSGTYAQQSVEAGVNEFEATYMALELGANLGPAKVFIGNETLGSDDGAYGFQTSLATKHAFNGWADKFLATPATGLVDTYVKAVGKVEGVKLLGMYHTYEADDGGADLGSELNLLAVKKLNKNFTAGVKYASYSAGDTGVDTDKVWVWVSAKL